MENFNWTKINRKIAIKAPMPLIYDAWSKSANLETWFLETAQFMGSDNQKMNVDQPAKAGNNYQWTWFLYDGVENGKVLEANGKDLFSFSFAGDCKVTIQLSTQYDFTIVELTQENIPTDEKSKKDIRIGCDFGWYFFLINLKSTYEGGIDLRNKDPKLKGMLNS